MYPRSRRKSQQPQRVPAAVALREDEFHARPWGPCGERVVPRLDDQAPSQPATRAFVIPPVNWLEEQREQPAVEPGPARPIGGALAELIERDIAAGVHEDPRPPLGPPAHTEPLPRIRFPEPVWRDEEREATRRNARERVRDAAQVLAEHEREPAARPSETAVSGSETAVSGSSIGKSWAPTYPAKPASDTPRLDEVKSWIAETRR